MTQLTNDIEKSNTTIRKFRDSATKTDNDLDTIQHNALESAKIVGYLETLKNCAKPQMERDDLLPIISLYDPNFVTQKQLQTLKDYFENRYIPVDADNLIMANNNLQTEDPFKQFNQLITNPFFGQIDGQKYHQHIDKLKKEIVAALKNKPKKTKGSRSKKRPKVK